jgi:hypothetical protein
VGVICGQEIRGRPLTTDLRGETTPGPPVTSTPSAVALHSRPFLSSPAGFLSVLRLAHLLILLNSFSFTFPPLTRLRLVCERLLPSPVLVTFFSTSYWLACS